jgi:hypothetical protein
MFASKFVMLASIPTCVTVITQRMFAIGQALEMLVVARRTGELVLIACKQNAN